LLPEHEAEITVELGILRNEAQRVPKEVLGVAEAAGTGS
jgi:hypothetical protein